MPSTSPFFNSVFPGQTSEQGLVDDLVREQIKIYGLDVLYMPRRHLNLDRLLHESTKVAFEFAMPIPMYLKTVDGFDNGMEVLSKFGVRSSDEITLVMSRSEFTTYYAPYLKSYYNSINGADPKADLDELIGETSDRPKEGDLIFFPFDNSVFEIKYVNFDQPFFQLGRGYVFEINCEKFEYSGENFTTNYEKIDNAQTITDYSRLEFDMMGGGTKTFHKYERVTMWNITEQTNIWPDRMPTETGLVGEDGDSLATDVLQPEPYELISRVLRNEDEYLVTSDTEMRLIVEGLGLWYDYSEEGVLETDGVHNFVLYRDPGLLHRVDQVAATVMDWDAYNSKLVVGDLSDLDPDQEDENYDVTINKFDSVIIIGEDSGAYFIARKARTRPMANDDSEVIQQEFDQIKIADFQDDNPFGFV